MKKQISTIAIMISSLSAMAQTPKQHVFLDTVKIVKERVDFSPDTIPVYFKEVLIYEIPIADHWVRGYVVWQTYNKSSLLITSGTSASTYLSTGTWNEPKPYYVSPYSESDRPKDIFLYEDRKTKVKNPVIFTIKR